MKEAKVEPGIGAIPEIKTTYWYVGSSLQGNGSFRVIEAEWIGGMSDSLRLAKGNVYLDIKDANRVCMQLNERYEKIRNAIIGERQKERTAEEEARKKEEAAKKKAEREKNIVKTPTKFTDKEKALRYEANKQKREKKAQAAKQKVSPHPDIIV